MRLPLSVLMITKNAQETIEESLRSVYDWVDEIVVIDDYSTDNTKNQILNIQNQNDNVKFKIFINKENNLGRQRAFGLTKCSNGWVLVLDSDEIVTKELQKEIVKLLNTQIVEENGFYIPVQTHYLGRQLRYGGENYKKMVLFKKGEVIINPLRVGEKFELISGKAGQLKNKIFHYSYRSLRQIYRKFTGYAIGEAKDRVEKGEKTSIKKIFLYPPHMFWARFIKDKGYKDGLFRIPLDLGFAYMEFLTYFSMLFIKV